MHASSNYFLTKSGTHVLDTNANNRNHPGQSGGLYRSKSTNLSETSHTNIDHHHKESFFSHGANPNHTEDQYSSSRKTENGHGVLDQPFLSQNNADNRKSPSEKAPGEVEKTKTKLKFSEMPSRSKYTFFMLAVANFGAGCGFSLPAPFFPREAELKGASGTAVGLVFSSFQLVNFIACPIIGNFLTVLGAKFVYTSGILVAGSTAILFGFLDKGPNGTIFIVMSFVVRSVEALGVSAFSTASFAIISNEFPDHIASVFATLETCIGIGLMVGPTIGGALYEVGGFGLPFWFVGAVIVMSGLTIFTCLPVPTDTTVNREGTVFTLLRSPLSWVTMLCIMVGSCGLGFMDPTLSSHLDQFGLSTLEVGLFFVICPGIYAILAPFWGYLSDTKDVQAPLLIFGNLVCTLGFLCMGPSPLLPFLPRELWTVTLGLVFCGISIGCAIVPTMKCLVIAAREIGLEDNLNTFGLVSGLFSSLFSLGAFIGPSIGGALVDQIGFYYGSTIIAGFYLFAMLVSAVFFSLRWFRRKRLSPLGRTSPVDHLPFTESTPLVLADKNSQSIDTSRH